MGDVECPYCGSEEKVNHDDGYGYEEDGVFNQQCGNCEKFFVFTTSISFYYEAEKADCLNGAEHDYKKTVTYPVEYARLRCTICSHEKALPKKKPLQKIEL